MSNTKRYPTRMHEVLGVETGEIFTINEDDYGFYHTLDCDGQIVFTDPEDEKEYRVTADMVTSAINHGITRRPRLTQEQLYALEALYRVFGCKWIVYDAVSDWVLASAGKPTKTDRVGEWTFRGPSIDLFLSDVLCKMASEATPLDIVQTLRDAGVTLTDPNQP